MRKTFWLALVGGLLVVGLLQASVSAAGGPVPRGALWYDNALVRTLVPPSQTPNEGRDPLYMVPGVGGVAAVAPGDTGYHGGHWQVWLAGDVDPGDILNYGGLNSASEVLTAAVEGAITLTRDGSKDFRCPLQP